VGLHSLLRDSFTFLNVGYVRTSHETHILASTACYRDSFTFLYVADVRTSQETYYSPPQPVMMIALLFKM
jgi:hypothetical protein